MKAIIIGTSLSGKTTLVRYLRTNTKLPILEVDEELTRLNNGVYPTDNKYKHTILIPQIVEDILNRDNIVFFTNTNYFTPSDLKNARSKGFKIVQLWLDLNELQKRNKFRMENEGYPDVSEWLSGMTEYQTEIKQLGLADLVIDANLPTEEIAKKLMPLVS